MNHYNNLAFAKLHGFCLVFIKYIVNNLNLKEMITRSQGSNLGNTAFICPVRNRWGFGTAQCALLFGMHEIFVPAVSFLNSPAWSVDHDLCKFIPGYTDSTLLSNPGWNRIVDWLQELFKLWFDIRDLEICTHQSNAAVDVISNTTGWYYPVIDIKRGYTAYWKAISPVDIWHGQGITNNTGKMGNIGDLLRGIVREQMGKELIRRKDDTIGSHPSLAWNTPPMVVKLF